MLKMQEDAARQRANENLRWPLRDLAANLMRITRGAGKPYHLVNEINAVVSALNSYKEAFGHFPDSDTLRQTLNISLDEEKEDRLSDRALLWFYAEEKMMKGGLQMAASKLLGQTPQERMGHREVFEGLTEIEHQRAENVKNSRGFSKKRRGPPIGL